MKIGLYICTEWYWRNIAIKHSNTALQNWDCCRIIYKYIEYKIKYIPLVLRSPERELKTRNRYKRMVNTTYDKQSYQHVSKFYLF